MIRRIVIIAATALCACSPADGTDPEPLPGNFTLALQSIASGLSNPVYVTAPPGDSRLFAVEQAGRIRIIQNGQLVATPFLDISSRVSSGGERGLLSLAFHPQYQSNGFFYVYFTGLSGEIRVERFSVGADPGVANGASAKVILTVVHPRSNHNGGLALFGPDGMLYLGLGDGGGAGDPDRNGQNINTLLGALLRINVDAGDPYSIPTGNPFVNRTDARPEIWALGLRNPWRFAFDAVDGLLYVADVGQNAFEEVNVIPSSRGGANFGWNVMEASACYGASTCAKSGLELPVVEYSHAGGGCSITGGFVYRGPALPEIAGHYFYSDYCAGFIRSFRFQNGGATDQRTWDLENVGSVTSFGRDGSGEIYLTTSGGRVYKLVRGS